MRKLSKEEKRQTKQGIQRLEWDIQKIKYNLALSKMLLEQGLDFEFEEKKRGLQQKLKQYEYDLQFSENYLKNMKSQLKNGVPKKKEIIPDEKESDQ